MCIKNMIDAYGSLLGLVGGLVGGLERATFIPFAHSSFSMFNSDKRSLNSSILTSQHRVCKLLCNLLSFVKLLVLIQHSFSMVFTNSSNLNELKKLNQKSLTYLMKTYLKCIIVDGVVFGMAHLFHVVQSPPVCYHISIK